MDKTDLVKGLIILFLYGMAAPAAALILRNWRRGQRAAFALLCFMTTSGFLSAGEWGLTLSSFEYRGHERGYHFYFAEVLALALVLAKFLDGPRRFPWWPPGLWLYLLYCAMSFISIINAPAPAYVLMAALKFVKIALIFLAGYSFLATEPDLHFFLQAMGATMLWQLAVVLKMKYLNGLYQVPGTFEHQNALSMFDTMIGLVFLAVTLGPRTRSANFYLLAYVACAVIQQATLSRAGLVIFGAGSIGVGLLSLGQRFSGRRLVLLSALAGMATVGVALSLDTIIGRFHEYGNQASGKTRQLLNTASRRMLEDYPLGIGWNNFGLVINKPWPYGKVIDDWERAGAVKVDESAPKGIVESHYYLILAETGYQSLAAYLLCIFVFLGWNLRGWLAFRNQFLGALSLGIAAGMSSNYIQSFFERVLTQPRNLMLWMLLLAATARIEARRRERRKVQAQGARSQPRAQANIQHLNQHA